MPDGLDVGQAAREEELVCELGAVCGGRGGGGSGGGGDDGFELGSELVLVLSEAGGGVFGGRDAVPSQKQFWGEACVCMVSVTGKSWKLRRPLTQAQGEYVSFGNGHSAEFSLFMRVVSKGL